MIHCFQTKDVNIGSRYYSYWDTYLYIWTFLCSLFFFHTRLLDSISCRRGEILEGAEFQARSFLDRTAFISMSTIVWIQGFFQFVQLQVKGIIQYPSDVQATIIRIQKTKMKITLVSFNEYYTHNIFYLETVYGRLFKVLKELNRLWCIKQIVCSKQSFTTGPIPSFMWCFKGGRRL